MRKRTITEKDKLHELWYEKAKKQTIATLPNFLKKLDESYVHDYGTICHAVAAAALAAAYAMNKLPSGNITGFQAGAVMWQFISKWQGMEGPLRLVQYENLLFPQYELDFTTISADVWAWAQKEAKKRLKQRNKGVNIDVLNHWKSVADGRVPFGLRISGLRTS